MEKREVSLPFELMKRIHDIVGLLGYNRSEEQVHCVIYRLLDQYQP
ncbi:MAG: hypothetical protein NWE89_05200 [Candidatus Bathyarchaeota archaeon]|nr:hypothetical protein [Candidatus Bathyarchaeota archaeon]